MLKRTLPFAIALVLMSTAAHTRQAGSQSAGGANAAKAGEFEFRINCAFCHGLGARGGGRGPDLTGVAGTRTIEAITDSVRNPSRRLAQGLMEATKEFAQEYETVTVVTSDGTEIKGTTLNEDDFSVQVVDQSDRLHLFEKDKLRSFTKSRNSLMPPYKTSLLSDQDLQDIIAYLISVAQ